MILLDLRDSDFGIKEKEDVNYSQVTSARAIVKKQNSIALLYMKNKDYYMIPGGRIEKNETIEQGLRREILEETGCSINIENQIGLTVEHKSHLEVIQTTHFFLAEVKKQGSPNFTQDEIKSGIHLIWPTLDEAIELIKNNNTQGYNQKFIKKRALKILSELKLATILES